MKNWNKITVAHRLKIATVIIHQRGFPLINPIISQRKPLFKENFTKDEALMGERGMSMRSRLITVIYVISSFLDNFAYFVIGRGEDESDREIKTPWGNHTYCN